MLALVTDDAEGDELQAAVEAIALKHGYIAVQLLAVRIEPDGRTLVRDKHMGNIYLRFGVVSEWLAEALKPEK